MSDAAHLPLNFEALVELTCSFTPKFRGMLVVLLLIYP